MYKIESNANMETIKISLLPSIENPVSMINRKFCFLNKCNEFKENTIDWNFSDYGKLWAYNLNYFDFLHQSGLSKEQGLNIIHNYINSIEIIKYGKESYPISLRGINWIKFLSINSIQENEIISQLFIDYTYLYYNMEYHLLGNHLLENGFSLLWASYLFYNRKLYNKAKSILSKELKEQILSDGAHFELSPMYHQTILYRVLDCINLLKNNDAPVEGNELCVLFEKTAYKMLSWLNEVTFTDGSIPLVNDSSIEVAPSTNQLNKYAISLGLSWDTTQTLSDSGYRKISKKDYELFLDVGNIGPDYIPGHAHSDTFNYILHINQKPFIVDVGVSTYERNDRRHYERSTEAHNTVKINNINQSDVWASFRVANRAKIVSLEEDEISIKATHDGYKRLGVFHTRSFSYLENEVVLIDDIKSKRKNSCQSFIHLNPGIVPILESNVINTELGQIMILGADTISLEEYERSCGFNRTKKGYVVIASFSKKLETRIILCKSYL